MQLTRLWCILFAVLLVSSMAVGAEKGDSNPSGAKKASVSMAAEVTETGASPSSQTILYGVDGHAKVQSDVSPGQPLLDDITFLKKTADGLAFVPAGYKVCRDEGTHQEFIACGAEPCPPGTHLISYNPGDHPSCGGGGGGGGLTECVDMVRLGWVGGHKQKFCRARGYEGCQPYPGKKYDKGGMCWRNGSPDDCL